MSGFRKNPPITGESRMAKMEFASLGRVGVCGR